MDRIECDMWCASDEEWKEMNSACPQWVKDYLHKQQEVNKEVIEEVEQLSWC